MGTIIYRFITGFFVSLLIATIVQSTIGMFDLPVTLTFKQLFGALLLISAIVNSIRFSSDFRLMLLTEDWDEDNFKLLEKWGSPFILAIMWLINWGAFYIVSIIL
jgi:hypothetical protein